MGRAGLEPALLQQELGPKPSAYANFATCPYMRELKIQFDQTAMNSAYIIIPVNKLMRNGKSEKRCFFTIIEHFCQRARLCNGLHQQFMS